jgi:hypothetical protein
MFGSWRSRCALEEDFRPLSVSEPVELEEEMPTLCCNMIDKKDCEILRDTKPRKPFTLVCV